MDKIDWKTKLTSRKFWVAVIGFVTPLLIAFGISENDAAQVASIIMAGGTLVAYILGEGLVDSARVKSETKTVSTITNIKGNSEDLAAALNGGNGDDGKNVQ